MQNISNFLTNLKSNAKNGKSYGGNGGEKTPSLDTAICPNCGAGRNKDDGLTHCAYCGYQFILTKLSDGVYIKETDNSRDD